MWCTLRQTFLFFSQVGSCPLRRGDLAAVFQSCLRRSRTGSPLSLLFKGHGSPSKPSNPPPFPPLHGSRRSFLVSCDIFIFPPSSSRFFGGMKTLIISFPPVWFQYSALLPDFSPLTLSQVVTCLGGQPGTRSPSSPFFLARAERRRLSPLLFRSALSFRIPARPFQMASSIPSFDVSISLVMTDLSRISRSCISHNILHLFACFPPRAFPPHQRWISRWFFPTKCLCTAL